MLFWSIYTNISIRKGICNDRKKYRKKLFFEKILQRGLLWSYAKNLTYSPKLDTLLIEKVLKYGDIPDLKKLFSLYHNDIIKKVWEKTMIMDTRFIKSNYFLARSFFGMDVEADVFKGSLHDREKRFRVLAS